jgi:Xaa-Pro aminopeptidase
MAFTFRPDWSGRLARLQARLSAQNLDAFVVTTPLNVTYLTGFTGSAGLLVVRPDRTVFVTDGRYDLVVRRAMAEGGMAASELVKVDRRYDQTLAALVARDGLRTVGFEAGHVTVSTLAAWGRATGSLVTWMPVEKLVEGLRAIKDSAEIEVFRLGGRMISEVARRLSSIVQPGRTEREVAARLDAAILEAGFERLSFPTIVAAGPHSAQPHATPGDRPLSPGDLVVLDFGGVLSGYCTDLTRAAAVGQVSKDAKSLFDAVYEAREAAVKTVRPGRQTSELDRAAREVLEAKGLGEAFSHSTGHGLGLEIHEAPRVARADPDAPEAVEVGMVFTIEPGAYLESVGGVRLEDDVLVTATGAEVLTTAPLDLLVV